MLLEHEGKEATRMRDQEAEQRKRYGTWTNDFVVIDMRGARGIRASRNAMFHLSRRRIPSSFEHEEHV